MLDICLKDLFAEIDDLKIKYPDDTVKAILRVRDMYAFMVKYPSKKDADFIKEDCARYKISRPTAYADLNLIKALLPDLSKTSREFAEWRFSEMILETYEIAKFKKNVRTMERAAATYAKYMHLDREQEQEISFENTGIQPFVPTDDPSVLGFKPIPDRRKRIEMLIKKYSADVPDLADVDYEEVDVREVFKSCEENMTAEDTPEDEV